MTYELQRTDSTAVGGEFMYGLYRIHDRMLWLKRTLIGHVWARDLAQAEIAARALLQRHRFTVVDD